MDNAISFRSNIKFIHPIDFLKTSNKGSYIGFFHNETNILKCDKFHTKNIRTCTAGGIINPLKESLGFHILDDNTNKNKLNEIETSILKSLNRVERGVLIGSKNLTNSPFSIEMFEKFKSFLSKHIPKLSIFEEHRHSCSQSHFCYSLEDDTWLITTDYINNLTEEYNYVHSLQTLKEAFRNIKIANGDKLFIENKEITSKDAPELFY